MKRFYRLFLVTAAAASLTACSDKVSSSTSEPEKNVTPDSITYSWQAPYEAKIKEFKSSDTYSDNSCFDLYDLTDDGSPELIISPNGDATTKCLIYTLEGEVISELGEFGNNGTFSFCPDTKVIKDEYVGSGMVLGKIYSLTSGPLKTVMTYSDNSASASMGAAIYHEVNGENLSLSDYEKALEPYSALNTTEIGRRFTMGDKAVNYGIYISENWAKTLTSNQKKLFKDKLTAESALDTAEGRNGAFDFCDLNGDNVPELIISSNTAPESTCKVYYFSAGQLVEMEGEYGINGTFGFDVENLVFFSDKKYWSIANTEFKANEYTESDSTIITGRKYPLSESGISAVLD